MPLYEYRCPGGGLKFEKLRPGRLRLSPLSPDALRTP